MQDYFKASWQWFSRFRERRVRQQLFLHGEVVKVDRKIPYIVAALNRLYAIITKYDPKNVYTVTWAKQAYFFGCCPNTYNLLTPFKDISSTRGKKKAKEKVSLVVCANGTGKHKIPSTLIGKAKFPACIKNREWHVKYISRNKAWMDVSTCWKWFEKVFYPKVRKRTVRPVLLLMDNSSRHFTALERNDIKVFFFPPNCTSRKQSGDMGNIAALKKDINIYISKIFWISTSWMKI